MKPTVSIDLELYTACTNCGRYLDFKADQDVRGVVVLTIEPCSDCTEAAIQDAMEKD